MMESHVRAWHWQAVTDKGFSGNLVAIADGGDEAASFQPPALPGGCLWGNVAFGEIRSEKSPAW